MSATGRAMAATWRAGWRQARADRRAFFSQLVVMVLNDGMWIVFWLLFFRRVGPVRGWSSDGVMTLMAIAFTAFGVVVGLLANSRHIGEVAASGELDAALALPVPTLPYLLCRRIQPLSVGDVFFGAALFLIADRPDPLRIAGFVVAVACSSVLITGILVLSGSLSLLAGRREPGDMGFHLITLFSLYPVDVFGGATKLFLYLIIPAGFVAAVPTRLLDDPDPAWAAAAVAAAAVFAAAGWLTFGLAVRRHTSGSAWTGA